MAWLGAIFTATSLPSSVFPHVGLRDADKGVHFFMYGGLGLLLARAVYNPPRTSRLRVVITAILMVAAVGAVDEWHQKYMKGRTTDFHDWIADTSGGLVGALIWAAGSRTKATRTSDV